MWPCQCLPWVGLYYPSTLVELQLIDERGLVVRTFQFTLEGLPKGSRPGVGRLYVEIYPT